ncbi:MAG: DUF58 domain-containing protein [Victivallaceae bacterium]|nr:DUF58 domain-containing protein [Victivallaceae bacterium]
MLPAELMRQIRRLELRTDLAVEELVGGAYRSVFKGRGIEFDEVREYTADDDVRDIDWNVSARFGRPFIKKYMEERKLDVLFMVDLSRSGDFGEAGRSKREAAALFAATLAFSAGANGDKVGTLLFTDRMEKFLPLRSGRKHSLRLIRDLLAYEPESPGTDIALALQEADNLLDKKSVVFLISDFAVEKDFSRELKILRRKHDVIAVRILDPSEQNFPFGSAVRIIDSESGREVFYPGTRRGGAALRTAFEQQKRKIRQLCDSSRVDLIDIDPSGDIIKPVLAFFERRGKRAGRGR